MTGGVGPEGVLRIFAATPGATRVVLVRHGEAACNVNRVVGGVRGCSGLTELGRRQVAALAERLGQTGEMVGVSALYASVLPRAVETAEQLRPVLGSGAIVQQCDLCELHPGMADGMEWQEVLDTFGVPDWDQDADIPIAPGGESWTAFVARASGAIRGLAQRHPGETVVAAVHAGVIEASMIAFLGIDPVVYRRGWVRIVHASLTEWEWVPAEDRWILLRFNDSCGVPSS
ncbi:MAG TPA: histidine phosphatase family protein [Acidimicrobiales bacterium]|nr:histidine phosphatase family protein [Acidimicrobiales bacterium]